MSPFVMALLGAFCWGIAPLFGKVGLRGVHPIDGLVARTLVTMLFILGMVIAKGRVAEFMEIPRRCWGFLAAEAFLATFAGDLAYFGALKYGETGKTALVLAISPLFTIGAGWLFLGELLSPVHIIGAALVIVGLVLINF